jgi:hypothetical protein
VHTPSAHALGRAAALAALPAVVQVPAPAVAQSAFDVQPISSLPVHTRHGHEDPGGAVQGRFADMVCDELLKGCTKLSPLPLMLVRRFGGQS